MRAVCNPVASWARRLAACLVLAIATLVPLASKATTPTYTRNTVWDADHRKVFEIAADPGTGVRTAIHYIYDANGRLIEVDKGTTTQANASDFVALETTLTAYDPSSNMRNMDELGPDFDNAWANAIGRLRIRPCRAGEQ